MQEDVWDVIIIGAGAAGIAASKTLTLRGIRHLVIESRDRIGGRVYEEDFNGVRIDIGASFVHNPQKEDNIISKIVRKYNMETINARYESEAYFYEN